MLGGGNKNVHVKYEYSEKKKNLNYFKDVFSLQNMKMSQILNSI